jgi:hypothetical protein
MLFPAFKLNVPALLGEYAEAAPRRYALQPCGIFLLFYSQEWIYTEANSLLDRSNSRLALKLSRTYSTTPSIPHWPTIALYLNAISALTRQPCHRLVQAAG